MVFKATSDRLGRHLSHLTGHIELPAMIDAAQSAVFVSAKDQRSTAVRARLINQTDTTFRIPESHQIFTKQSDTLWLPVLD
jgi:hypothetical protein